MVMGYVKPLTWPDAVLEVMLGPTTVAVWKSVEWVRCLTSGL